MRTFLDTADIDEILQAAKPDVISGVTVPFKVLTQMIEHPLTDAGLARFTQDWERASKRQ